MNNPPKNHHYVPQCYLNSFANSQKKFWKLRNDNSRISETMPVKVCYEVDANRIRNKQFLEINHLEDEYFIEKNSFKYQENNFSKVLPTLIKFSKEQIIADKTKHQLFLETLITIKRRNPDSRNKIIQAFKEGYKTQGGIKRFLENFAEESGIQKIPPEIETYIKNYLANESQDPNRLHDMYLSAYLSKVDYTTITEITKCFYNLKQYILHAPIGQQFITSDNPGFTVTGGAIISLGGLGGQFEFYFPLSPTSCLYLKSTDVERTNVIEKIIYPVMLNKSDVIEINRATRLISMKCVFAYNKKTLEIL